MTRAGWVLFFGMMGCHVKPNPVPVPPPPDVPPNGGRICNVGEVCGCWDKPPGQDWRYLGDCAEAPPADSCAPGLHPDLLPPMDDNEHWKLRPDLGQVMATRVIEAIQSSQLACPSAWNGSCLVGGPAEIDLSYARVAGKLHLKGIAAGQLIDQWGKHADALFVKRVDGRWEEWKLFEYGHGCLTGNPFKNVFDYTGEGGPNPQPTPEPTPSATPPPSGQCAGPSPVGLPGRIVLKPHNNLWDSTYQVSNRGYCDATNQPGRNNCPIRAEGVDVEEKDCWQAIVVGDQKWWCDDNQISHTDNPAQAKCQSSVRTCTESGATCAVCVWPNECR